MYLLITLRYYNLISYYVQNGQEEGTMELEIAYYTIEQASKILQLSPASIYRGIKKGQIPKAKFCGKVLIPAWFIKQGFEKESYERGEYK